MKCTPINLGGGVTGVICGPRRRLPKCATPGCTNDAPYECDFPVVRANRKSQTCDKRICERCRVVRGENVDHCPPHGKLPVPQALPGV